MTNVRYNVCVVRYAFLACILTYCCQPHSVIDIEQLTGEGAPNNANKLQASSEYLQQLELFTEQEFDELEHPEDSPEDSGVEGSD